MPAYQYQQGDRPLDGYTIQYALGRGGFGEVYFAVSDAGREVALKVVQNFEDIELRGIRHCMNLKSQHLVTIFDVRFAADGAPWVIMEYVAGPSLREIIDESPTGLGPQRTAFLFRELVKGIRYLHDAGVVHRDLKPHNVFFEDGIVKIGDYSLSKAITTSHRSGHTMTVGSVHYMAPEISLGRYDKTVDIYALGVMLYEMLCGVPPYIGESMGEVLMKHLSSTPDVSGLPEPFATTIAKAMQRDPAERFESAQAMAESLPFEKEALLSHRDSASLSQFKKRTHDQLQSPAQPLADTFTSPGMLNDTRPTTPIAAEDAPPQRVDLFQQFGLWYTASTVTDRNPEPLSRGLRYTFAMIAMMTMSTAGLVLSQNEVSLLLLLVNFSVANVICILAAGLIPARLTDGVWCGFPNRFHEAKEFNKRVWAGLASRAVLVGAAVAILATAASKSMGSDLRSTLEFASGIVLSLLVLDWRCFMAADRHHRIALRPTIGVGVVALLGSYIGMGKTEFAILSAAYAMGIAIGLQLVAPLRRAKLLVTASASPAANFDTPQVATDQTKTVEEIV